MVTGLVLELFAPGCARHRRVDLADPGRFAMFWAILEDPPQVRRPLRNSENENINPNNSHGLMLLLCV